MATVPEKRTPGYSGQDRGPGAGLEGLSPDPHGPIGAPSFAKKSWNKSLLLWSLPLPESEAPASAP